MSVELLLCLGLVAIFVVPMATDVNVGVVALVAAMLTGTLLLDLPLQQVLAGFPMQMFVLMAGVTLLLAIAQGNGTIEWIVGKLMSLAGGRLALLPLLLFVTAFITASLGPGAAPLLMVIGVGFVARFDLNPLLVAALVIHGTQSGAYSPIAPYGVVLGQLAADSGIEYSPWQLYSGVVVFHLALILLVFFVLGGRRLIGRRFDPAEIEAPLEGTPMLRYATLGGFILLLVSVLSFGVHLCLAAMTISLVLLILSPRERRSEAVNNIAWPIVLVISGALTYVNLIQGAGAVDWLADQLGLIGSPALIGLLLSYLVSIVTGVASTVGTIGMLVPLSAPFIVSGEIDGTGLLTAMAVAAAVSDVSPFSTWGALYLATAASVVDRQLMLRRQLIYTGVVMLLLPALAWFIFVVLAG